MVGTPGKVDITVGLIFKQISNLILLKIKVFLKIHIDSKKKQFEARNLIESKFKYDLKLLLIYGSSILSSSDLNEEMKELI